MSADDFKLFDVDGKGYITPADFDAALKKINKSCSPAYQKQIFDAADKNKDGKVDPDEFRAMMNREGALTPAGDIISAFEKLADEDGTLSMSALKDLMSNWGDKMSDEEVDFMIKDVQGKFLVTDGKLDYKKFAQLMASKTS
eukprot:g2800.t1